MLSLVGKNLFKCAFNIKETRGLIISDKVEAIEESLSSLMLNRMELEAYIKHHPDFLSSLEPVHVDSGPRVVRLMASSSEKANVGPMASVAGALADLAVEAATSAGAKVVIVENGGEVSAVSDREVNVALLAGNHPLSKFIGFRLNEFPIGVATSSGLFGHALSFGNADAVTVFSESAGLADAAATATCNVVNDNDHRKAIEAGINRALSIEGVKGVLIIYGGTVGIAGEVPEIIKIKG